MKITTDGSTFVFSFRPHLGDRSQNLEHISEKPKTLPNTFQKMLDHFLTLKEEHFCEWTSEHDLDSKSERSILSMASPIGTMSSPSGRPPLSAKKQPLVSGEDLLDP